jgi:hypothetical protein
MTNRNTDNNWTIGNYKNNRYREVDDYIEVEIYGGGEYHIGQIDKDFLERFTERTWGATKQKQENIFYMYSRATTNFPYNQFFHRLVIPDVDQVDHKDGNTLDNRKKNLRDGSGVINNNNKALHNTNTSGVNGVYFSKRDKSWVAMWYENGKRRRTYFSITKYGSDEKAKQEAIKHRQAMDEITGCTNGIRKKSV